MRQKYRFQLLAPPQASTGVTLGHSKIDEQLYYHYLTAMQRLRGRVYLKDGAIQPWELDDNGCFRMFSDEQSWHFLLIEGTEVVGCARYLVHPNTVSFYQLRLSHAALTKHPLWGEKVRKAVNADLRRARDLN